MIYLIGSTDLVPSAYFSPRLARQYGGAAAWTEVAADALQFAREQDARTFIDVYLPALAPICTITRHEGSSNA